MLKDKNYFKQDKKLGDKIIETMLNNTLTDMVEIIKALIYGLGYNNFFIGFCNDCKEDTELYLYYGDDSAINDNESIMLCDCEED